MIYVVTQSNLDQVMQEAAASMDMIWAFIFAWVILIPTLIAFKKIGSGLWLMLT